jgi:hypothetical protein
MPRQGTSLENLATPGTWGTGWSTEGLATVSSPPMGNVSKKVLKVEWASLDLNGCHATTMKSRVFWLTPSQGYVAVRNGPIVLGAAGGGLFVSKGQAVAGLLVTPSSPAFFIAFLVHADRSCTLHIWNAKIHYEVEGVGSAFQSFHHPIVLHPYTWRS